MSKNQGNIELLAFKKNTPNKKPQTAMVPILPPKVINCLGEVERVLEKIRSDVAYIKVIIRDHEIENECEEHENFHLAPETRRKKS